MPPFSFCANGALRRVWRGGETAAVKMRYTVSSSPDMMRAIDTVREDPVKAEV